MLIRCCLLLMLRLGGCTDDQISETRTVAVGDDVTLTCARNTSSASTHLFWIRHVSVNVPEFLGGTFTFDYDEVNTTPRFRAKQEPGTFVLQINKTQPGDTGLYSCIQTTKITMTFLKVTFLVITGPELEITALIHVPPSDPVRPGDSVSLQCSVFSGSESRVSKDCPGGHSVHWFRTGSDESHPSLIYTHGSRSDKCEKKCFYNVSKNVSSSDAGTYYCAVAACGQILFGNGTKLDIEALNTWDSSTAFLLLCGALAISLVVIALLIYTISKKSCGCCNAAVLQTNAATARRDQQRQERDEETLTYSAPTFTKKRADKAQRRNVKAAEGEVTYSDIRLM